MATNKNTLVGPSAIIHLDALIHNFREVQRKLKNKPIMAVVKANGYGHGAVSVSKALEKAGAKYFAVFTIEEARELRMAEIKSDIFIFSRFHPDSLNEAVENNFTLNISCMEDIDNIIEFARNYNKAPKVHIKIDTGMSRLGLDMDEIDLLFEKLNQNPEIQVEGIYSHYATADEGDLSYAKYQLDKFQTVIRSARDHGIEFKFVHLSNSGTVLNLPESYFDIVRVGMLLYGAYPSDEVPMDLDLKQVMEFTGPIVSVRNVPKGTHVSYGGVYKTKNTTNLAVVQTGFADGFPRPWYKNGFVMYKGEKYPVAGRVCMDQLMVDFGNTIPSVGDSVLFWGENSNGKITVEEISKSIESTPYVLLTGIHGRTERINHE